MKAALRGLTARWRAFAGEADAVRDASVAIASAIRAARSGEDRPMGALPRLSRPVDGRITSRFAMRDGRLHEGIDIAQREGTPVRPAMPGVVLLADELPGYGRVVVIDHGGDVATVYGHLSSVDVAAGVRAEPARPIGAVGTTGRAFGAHLHFEVRFDGTAVDPLVFLAESGAGTG